MYFPIRNPRPDFQQLKAVLKGEKEPKKVHFMELSVDREVIEYILDKMMNEKLYYLEAEKVKRDKLIGFTRGQKIVILDGDVERAYYRQNMNFYYRMGYDCFTDIRPFRYLASMVMPKVRVAEDTAILPRKGGYYDAGEKEGKREWVEEESGVITCWGDFEKFPWERMKVELDSHYDFIDRNLPEGMKVVVSGSLYEQVLERILGYKGLFFLLNDDPELVGEVTKKWSAILFDFYSDVIERDAVGGIFHADDLGYKTGTMVSPSILRNLFFPQFKKYARLAHEHGKLFLFHSCGNHRETMEDLINDVSIDAFHSFEDVIIPVIDFRKKYTGRIAVIGGVDMDKLARLDEGPLRTYIRKILEECMPGGRYALGSGNTIANYIPVKNYLIMLEEGVRFGK
jgi:uroporphyrinogen decarboxylase